MDALVGLLSSNDPDQRLEAVWCITNIAAGDHEQCLRVTKAAAAYIITYLSADNTGLQVSDLLREEKPVRKTSAKEDTDLQASPRGTPAGRLVSVRGKPACRLASGGHLPADKSRRDIWLRVNLREWDTCLQVSAMWNHRPSDEF